MTKQYEAPADTVRVIAVIESALERRGVGVPSDPIRIITQYWTLDGRLICEIDPCDDKNINKASI